MNIQLAKSQKGFTLVEALVSFAIVATGMLAIVSFQAGLFTKTGYNKARTEALSLAQQKIEQFRHYTHASEDNYIDNNSDGIMDVDGTYTENPIDGQNAVFTRSWELTTTGDVKQIDVTVSWIDAANQTQSVMLGTAIGWISPRMGADQLAELADPIISSPTGHAELGEGNLSDYPPAEISPHGGPTPDGLDIYRHNDNLLLVDATGNVLLTLIDACSTFTGTCDDFVKISGTVYVDTANTMQNPADIFVIASDAAHCERWVPSGTLLSPPTTTSGDYIFYNYTCYLGGGWHGNIGFVTSTGIQQRDKMCQGDPTALDIWDQPVIALRRAYRGMIQQNHAGTIIYFSQGIKNAANLTGHDYVFTELAISQTEGAHCVGADAPMTRSDSSNGMLFHDVPADFFCLNTDIDGDQIPDYLDDYDTALFNAEPWCPYDPTDPPVQSHKISGTIDILSAEIMDLSNFTVGTSDGPGNCAWVSNFSSSIDGYQATYSCTVYDWGNGWTGFVEIEPNSNYIYCPSVKQHFSAVVSDQSHSFGCISTSTVVIRGSINVQANSGAVSSMVITDLNTGFNGICDFNSTSYRCLTPYDGINWDGTITVTSDKYVCGATSGVFTFMDYTVIDSPYTHNIEIRNNVNLCP